MADKDWLFENLINPSENEVDIFLQKMGEFVNLMDYSQDDARTHNLLELQRKRVKLG